MPNIHSRRNSTRSPPAAGMCITEAAEFHQQLTAVEYLDQHLRLFEHWSVDTDEGSDEPFDEVLVDRVGEVTWM